MPGAKVFKRPIHPAWSTLTVADDAGRQVAMIQQLSCSSGYASRPGHCHARFACADLRLGANGLSRRQPVLRNPTAVADVNITTLKSYTSDGNIAELIAVNPITGNQRTRYIYGTALPNPSASSNGDLRAMDLLASDPGTNDIARSDLLVGVIYPDAADSTDSVQNVYNRQGQIKQTRDQNGTVHQFGFDGFARRVSDTVALFGANVDQTIKRIDLAYEIRGMLNLVTSYGDTTGMSIVNQVLRQFNAFAQLQYEYQQHDGPAVPFVSPAVQYEYQDGSANTIRPTAIIPPAGSSYATAFTYSGDDDALDRPTTVGGNAQAAYEYFGLGGIAAVNYLTSDTPIIASTLATGSSYPCFDQFGRLIEVPWTKVSDSSEPRRSAIRLQPREQPHVPQGRGGGRLDPAEIVRRNLHLRRHSASRCRRPRPLSFCSLSLDGRGPR